MPVALVTDSPAYLPERVAREHGIRVVPLHVVIGGVEHSEGVDIAPSQVASALRGFVPVSTSRPSPQAFLDAYEAAAAAGATAVVSAHISSALSSTIGSAQLAASGSPVPVEVVDSQTLGMALGYAVLAGARAAAADLPAHDVARIVRERCFASRITFYVDTLEHLRRGGRIGRAGALVGSALAIKPILAVEAGQIVPLERVRTTSRALARIEEIALTQAHATPAGTRVDVAVQHLDAQDRAVALLERLSERLERDGDRRLVELGAVVGAHVGPGTLAVSVSPAVLGEV